MSMGTVTLEHHLRTASVKGAFGRKIELLVDEGSLESFTNPQLDAEGNRKPIPPDQIYGAIFTVGKKKKVLITGPDNFLLEAGDKITIDKTYHGNYVGVTILKAKIPQGVQGRELMTTSNRIRTIEAM